MRAFGSYWYIEGADGRHYCYAKEPSFSCPIASAEPDSARVRPLVNVARELGVDPEWLLRKAKGHSAHRRRVDGKLTEDCEACGHRLTRLGFRYWIAGPPPKDADGMAHVSRTINLAMGGSGFTMVEGPWYAKTKKDAQAWARGRARETREAA